MDNHLRELERAAVNDPEAQEKYFKAMKRLGYEIVKEPLDSWITVSDFEIIDVEDLFKRLSDKLKPEKLAKYYRFAYSFEVSGDDYNGSELDIGLLGYRLETDKEKGVRERREQKAEELKRKQEEQRREAEQLRRGQEEQRERALLEQLKTKYERIDSYDRYIEMLGPEAAESIRNYSPSYRRSWFWRKFSKLGDRTPEQALQDGDIDLVRRYALKQL